eukprot:m.141663 g.141663  ORF g.141663 m.141663 type:complete len:457 (+) comp22873_c0_seq3:284-1654(+)
MPLGEWGWETVQQSPPIGIAVALGGGALLSVVWEATVRSGLLSMGTGGVGASLTAILVAVQWLVIGTLLGCVGTLSGLYWVARQTGVTKIDPEARAERNIAADRAVEARMREILVTDQQQPPPDPIANEEHTHSDWPLNDTKHRGSASTEVPDTGPPDGGAAGASGADADDSTTDSVSRTVSELVRAFIEHGATHVDEECGWINMMLRFFWGQFKQSLEWERFLRETIDRELLFVRDHTVAWAVVERMSVESIDLGPSFPVFSGVSSAPRRPGSHDATFEFDVTFQGEFCVGLKLDLLRGRHGQVSVRVTKIAGRVQFRLRSFPHPHYTVSFINAPLLSIHAKLDSSCNCQESHTPHGITAIWTVVSDARRAPRTTSVRCRGGRSTDTRRHLVGTHRGCDHIRWCAAGVTVLCDLAHPTRRDQSDVNRVAPRRRGDPSQALPRRRHAFAWHCTGSM